MNPMERADHAFEEFARFLRKMADSIDPTGEARRAAS